MLKRVLTGCTLFLISSLLYGSTGKNYFKCKEVLSPSDQKVWIITKPSETRAMTAQVFLKETGEQGLNHQYTLNECRPGAGDVLLECEGQNQSLTIFSDLTAEYLSLEDFHQLKCCKTLRTLD